MQHWSEQDGSERKFWEFAAGLGLSPTDVYEKMGQDRLCDFPSKESVIELLKAAADGKQTKIKDGLKPQEALHGEARAIAWMDVYTPDGTMVNLTARQGATADDIVANTLELTKAWDMLQILGFTQVPVRPPRRAPGGNGGGGRSRPRQTATSRPEPTAPPSPAPPTPSPAPVTPPPAPVAPVVTPPTPAPVTPAPVAAPAASNGNVEMIDTIRITAPSGKPQVEFWRTGRRYPELKWNLGGEALMGIAPVLATLGYSAAHLDAVGSVYPGLSLKVHWVQSPKNAKWKDVTLVEAVAA